MSKNYWTGAGYSIPEWAALNSSHPPPGAVTETVYGQPHAIRLVVGPANMQIPNDFVLIDSYEKAVAHFGELGARRYRVLFEKSGPPTVFKVDDEAPTTEHNT